MALQGNFPLKDSESSKIYEGSYQYFKDQTMYCEETFEVFRNKDKTIIQFFAELFTRTSQGMLFSVQVTYFMNKSYIPILVNINKELGKDMCSETYIFIENTNTLVYEFKNKSTKNTLEIKPPPRFHIAAPTAVQSMTFIPSKRFDSSDINHYSVFHGQKGWTYESPPEIREFDVERVSAIPKKLKLNDFNLKAIPYRILPPQEENVTEISKQNNLINAHVSGHHSIPYLMSEPNGPTIKIKKLKNLLTEET